MMWTGFPVATTVPEVRQAFPYRWYATIPYNSWGGIFCAYIIFFRCLTFSRSRGGGRISEALAQPLDKFLTVIKAGRLPP